MTDEKKDIKLLNLTEVQINTMLEDLILQGFCKYDFNIGKINFTIKSLTWEEHEKLTKDIASISHEIKDFAQTPEGLKEVKRELTLNEFNAAASFYTIAAHLVHINNKTEFDVQKLSKNIVSIIAQKIAMLENTINTKILTVDEIKN